MAIATRVSAVTRVIDELDHKVAEARAVYGDIPAVRRLANDVERLRIDVNDLNDASPTMHPHEALPTVPMDDTPVDTALWVDADDEGVGGFRGPHQ